MCVCVCECVCEESDDADCRVVSIGKIKDLTGNVYTGGH